ncbi:MAG: DUF3343 domain-containing protein [Nitrospinae bacterium]|nr:DUF3343 domain-containing protein [Nitrospinota bacterium]
MSLCIAVFETTHETLRAEDFFRARDVKFRPVLKPRKIGSACRMALQFDCGEMEKALAAVGDGALSLMAFYRKDEDEWVKTYAR